MEKDAEAVNDAEEAVTTAKKAIDSLTTATEESGEAAEETGDSVNELSEQLQEAFDKAESLETITTSLTAAEELLTSALDEQTKSGSLSLDTALKLIDAGYASALAIDEETGAITLNKESYLALAQAKLEEQIASLETQRQSVQAALAMQDEALMALDLGKAYLNAAEARAALEGQDKSYAAQVAALEKLKGTLGSYTYTVQTAARTASSTSKKAQTQAEKDLGKYKELKAALDHDKAMDLVNEKAYYDQLARYRDQYLTDDDNLDEYRKVTEQIYSYDKSLVEAEESLWEDATEALVSELEDRVQSILDQQDKMAQTLADYGDLFTIEDNQMSLESIQSQINAINAYEEALIGLKEKGISDSLMDEVLSMDVDEATQYAEKLIAMTEEQWDDYNALWEEKQRRAVEVAQKFYQDQLDTLKSEYDDKLGQALSELTDTAFTSGQDTAQGLIDGLAAKESALYSKAQAMADEVSRILASAYAASGDVDGSHAAGLAYVPYDGYIAELHQGERVLTAEEARAYINSATPNSFDLPNSGQGKDDIGSMLSQAVNAIGTVISSNGGTYHVEIPVSINGQEFYRASIGDLRAVMKSDPEVTNDR